MERLINLFYMFWRVRMLRVAFFGGIGVVVQTIIFETLGIWLGLVRPSTAVLIGAEAGVFTSFFLNNYYSFNDRTHAPLLVRFLRFHLVVLGSLFIQWACVYTAEYFSTNFFVINGAYLAGILLGFVSNYTGYRLWVWKHHEAPQD